MNKQKLKKKIHLIELKLKQLSQHNSTSGICVDLCNSLILEKAVLKKQLEELEKNKFAEKIKKILPRREKLIRDYFN